MNFLEHVHGKFESAFHCIQKGTEPAVIMNNKLKLLAAGADRRKVRIIGAQVCCGTLEYAQLSYPQISV